MTASSYESVKGDAVLHCTSVLDPVGNVRNSSHPLDQGSFITLGVDGFVRLASLDLHAVYETHAQFSQGEYLFM